MAGKFYNGNDPDQSKYNLLGEVHGFKVWVGKLLNGYAAIKLVSVKKRKSKANFWFGVVTDTLTMKGRDYNLFMENVESSTEVMEFIFNRLELS